MNLLPFPLRRTLTAGLALASAAALVAPGPAAAAAGTVATVGHTAPAFTALDTSGKTVSLADFKGKTVVLEWVNPGCPFVVKHYASRNMQGTQQAAAAQGVVWLAVNSTATSHGDYRSPAQMAQWMSEHKAVARATLMDSDGKIGRAYGARTTPHMYLIDAAGTLVYAGAIDSIPTANPADIANASNHVKQALTEHGAGKPISLPSTRAYGCTVKYATSAG